LANPKLTFEQFVIGDSNRLAHAAALTVAEMPAHAYNPLFICGPPGVGKTHLLSSIAKLLQAHNPSITVRCTTGEAFTNEFIESLGTRRSEAFKSRFRDVDVLLLDDVQFLERKAKTEEELFQRSTRCTTAGARSCSPPTVRPTICRRSRIACASASPPASSPTSSHPTSPHASRSCASALSTTASSSTTSVPCTPSPSASTATCVPSRAH